MQCKRAEIIESQMKNSDQNSLLQQGQVKKQIEDSKDLYVLQKNHRHNK